MIRKAEKAIQGIALLLAFCLQAQAAGSPKTFAFVNSQYIITAETEGEHGFVVNFVNLSDFVIVIQPNEFIYKGASGRFYIGQVFESEHKDTRGELQKYAASVLLKGHSFAGLTMVGAFRERDAIDEMSIRIGAKRFYMQPLEKADFDRLAARIGNLDLGNSNAAGAIELAGISEMGTLKVTDGTSEWDRDWQGLITPEGINPPKIIERPEISPTEEAKKSRTYGKVRLSGFINKRGEIQELKVVKKLGRGLDQRAQEGVKSGWLFLPATKNGEVLDTAISIDVEFQQPEKKQ